MNRQCPDWTLPGWIGSGVVVDASSRFFAQLFGLSEKLYYLDSLNMVYVWFALHHRG